MASINRWHGDARRGESDYPPTIRTCDTASSYQTYSTAATEDSYYGATSYPYNYQAHTEDYYPEPEHNDSIDICRASFDTYASTNTSEEFLDEEAEEDYEPYEFSDEPYSPQAIASTPKDFATFFPTHRRMAIHHDDSTVDGNMNLRVDTEVDFANGGKGLLTLFHLRLHDLKARDFSLRRYCRDSGREVCHSTKNYQRPDDRLSLHKSIGSAFAPFLMQSSRTTIPSSLKRNDSGYGSMFEEQTDARSISSAKKIANTSSNVMKLEFSNYAQVEVERCGASAKKRYEFEYWGHSYRWRRQIDIDGDFEEVSYHLIRDDKDLPIAHIMPASLTREQARQEESKGGWVPPCSMWISDDDIIFGSPDVADVVVATGLIALVDDAIRRRWHSQRTRHVLLPYLDLEYIGPKRLIDEVFNRSKLGNTTPGSKNSRRTTAGQHATRR